MSGSLIGVNAPVRLMREDWETPKALAEELYAMFTAKGPAEINDTLTIKVPAGRPALRIERAEAPSADPATSVNQVVRNSVATSPATPGRRTAPRPQDEPSRRQASSYDPGAKRPASDQPAARAEPQARRLADSPLVEIDGPVRFSGQSPVQFSQPPVFVNEQGFSVDLVAETARRVKGIEPDFGAAGGGGESTMGVVVSGEGKTYQVRLYGKGFDKDPTGTAVVKIPYLAEGESLNQGEVIAPIFKIGDTYYYQPPVWRD